MAAGDLTHIMNRGKYVPNIVYTDSNAVEHEVIAVYKGSQLVWLKHHETNNYKMYFNADNLISIAGGFCLNSYVDDDSNFTFITNMDLSTVNIDDIVPMFGQVKVDDPLGFFTFWGSYSGNLVYTTGTTNRPLVTRAAIGLTVEKVTAIMSDGSLVERYVNKIPKVDNANTLIMAAVKSEFATNDLYDNWQTSSATLPGLQIQTFSTHPGSSTLSDFANNVFCGYDLGSIFKQIGDGFAQWRHLFSNNFGSNCWKFPTSNNVLTNDYAFGFKALDCESMIGSANRLVSMFRYNADQRDLYQLCVFCPENEACSRRCYILEFFKNDGSAYSVGETFDPSTFDATKTKLVGYSNANWSFPAKHDSVVIDDVNYWKYRCFFDRGNCTLKPGHLYGMVYTKNGSNNGNKLANTNIQNSSTMVNGWISQEKYNELQSYTTLYGQTIGLVMNDSFGWYIGSQNLSVCQHIEYMRFDDPISTYPSSLYPMNMLY